MATLQEQARALGDPTRHGIFRYVAESTRPVDIAELTDHFELNHNAIGGSGTYPMFERLVTKMRAAV